MTPIYNTNHEFLRQTIQSVLSQSFADFEFLIVNDSPEDKTLKGIVDEFHDDRIRYLENKENYGIAASRNRLMEEARGEYLAVLDHDDVCLPERLAKQVAYMEAHPEIGILSGLVEVLSTGKVHRKRYPEKNLDIKCRLLSENCLAHSAMMIRKSTVDVAKIRYDPLFSPAEDYMFCVAMMRYTQFHNLQETMLRYRDHVTNTTNKRAALMEDRQRVIASIARHDYSAFGDRRVEDWSLFGLFNIGRVKRNHSGKLFLLFGFIPLFLCR